MMKIKHFSGSPEEYYQIVKTDPQWFYMHCLLDGFLFILKEHNLAVRPANAIYEEMADLITRFKKDLIVLLNDEKYHKEAILI